MKHSRGVFWRHPQSHRAELLTLSAAICLYRASFTIFPACILNRLLTVIIDSSFTRLGARWAFLFAFRGVRLGIRIINCIRDASCSMSLSTRSYESGPRRAQKIETKHETRRNQNQNLIYIKKDYHTHTNLHKLGSIVSTSLLYDSAVGGAFRAGLPTSSEWRDN